MTTTPTITVSIINYRTGQMTIDCVQSVLDDLAGPSQGVPARVVVVDNLSGDGSAEMIAEWIAGLPEGARVELVRSASNSGFSGGHNRGMAAAPADRYLILNSDALLRPGFMRALSDAIEADPDAGLYVPRIEGEDGSGQVNCFRFAGPSSELIRGAASGPITRMLRHREVAMGPDPDPERIEWASFACIGVNDRLLREIGPMDEDYFLYFEDAEYGLRARRAGWRIRLVPNAVAVHFRGGSGPVKSLAKARKRLPRYYYQSRSRFLTQAHGRAGLLAANLLFTLGFGLRQLRRLFGKEVWGRTEGELRDIWIGSRQPLAPRAAKEKQDR